jgi:penicillin amidase
MIVALAAVVLGLQSPAIERDDWGVPRIKATSVSQAFYGHGMAQAQDRLWQMELSRSSAQGRLAELIGSAGVASDKTVLKRAYTTDEVQAQIDSLSDEGQDSFRAFADGVNSVMKSREAAGTLPPGYGGAVPRPWAPVDSAAIAINMLQYFGAGGAGELRGLAFLEYLKMQPAKDKKLDVFDDLLWLQEPSSPTTLKAEDDKWKDSPPKFPMPTRAETEAHLASLPKASIFELAAVLTALDVDESKLYAKSNGLPHKWGSYAIAVGSSRSKSGKALLLTAPQMGHTNPSVVHEVMFDAPGLQVAGMAVPGVPGVIIGNSVHAAWGMTSGVMDIEDIFVSRLSPDDDQKYVYGSETRDVQRVVFKRSIKGGGEFTVEQERTHHGPVMLRSGVGSALYSRQSAMAGRELSTFDAFFNAYRAKGAGEILDVIGKVPASFNFFVADTAGNIGWRYAGAFPVRAEGLDPRLPTPSDPANEWKGFFSADQMPHVVNPKSGLLSNWNNKPATWWPNQDPPVSGELFRSSVLEDAIPGGKLDTADLGKAAWTIARKETGSSGAFGKMFIAAAERTDAPGSSTMSKFDGWSLDKTGAPLVYSEAVKALRTEVFKPHIGTLLQPALFEQAVQTSVIWRAINGQTIYNFLEGRDADSVVDKALTTTLAKLARSESDPEKWSFRASRISVEGEESILYHNRGTYIQISEMTSPPAAKAVASPGIAETGDHSTDQAKLARNWAYKPLRTWQQP